MNFLPGALRGNPNQLNNPLKAVIGGNRSGLSSRSSLSRPSPVSSRRPSQDLISSSSTIGTFPSGPNDHPTNGGRPPAQRISRRSISRHPPTGTSESAVNVLDMLHGILGDLPASEKSQNEASSASQDGKPPASESPESEDSTANEAKSIYETTVMEKHNKEIPEDELDSNLVNFDEKMTEYEDLRTTIARSDKQLEELQIYLSSFQKDLDTLSADMESLETRSQQISQKLEVRQGVEKKLAPIVEALIIPPMIVRQIADADISLQWRSALKYIMQRQSELGMLKERGNFSAIKGAEEQLKLVTHRAIERIRDFIVTRIKSLRVAGINAQAVQKELLDYRELYGFLMTAHPALAKDLLQAYVNTMAWYYSSYFQRYAKSLEKLNLNRVDKSVLLGSDDSSRRGLLFYNRSTQTSMRSMDSLSLGNRVNIIASDDPSVMLAQIAETNNMVRFKLGATND